MRNRISSVIMQLSLIFFAACVTERAEAQHGYVLGVPNGEDLVPIPGTDWILASGMPEAGTGGRLTLIDRQARAAQVLYQPERSSISSEVAGNATCPGPIAPGEFAAHGLGLRQTGPKKGILYVVNHKGREAIEQFSLDWSGRTPRIGWISCIPLPSGAYGNGVAPLQDGDIAVTFTNAPEYAEGVPDGNPLAWLPKYVTGQTTGYAATWNASEGWHKVRGTEGSIPNGIEASPDGLFIYIAYSRTREVRRVPLGEGEVRTAHLDFMPDNLRLSSDGRLWTAGPEGSLADYFACIGKKGCHNGFGIASLDLDLGQVAVFPHPDTRPAFSDGTSALEADGVVWVGTSHGDRAAYFAKPAALKRKAASTRRADRTARQPKAGER